MGNPLPLNLAQECRKAEKILAEFVDPANGGLDRVIPMSVLRKAQGLAIFSVARLGFLMSARAGSGVVLARLQDDSWSAPSAIGLGGVGAGFNAGLDVTDFVIVLNSKQAVRSFMATGSLQLGGNLSVAVGPLGRAAEATGAVNSSGNLAAMFSYSKSKGLYGGVSVEGTILIDRSDANSKAYHRSVTAKQILSGSTEVPSFSSPLISLIEKYTMTGQMRADMDGRSASARGYGNYDVDNDVDSLDREFGATNISKSSRDPYSPQEDYDDRNPFTRTNSESTQGGYAFGSAQGGSLTNSPTRTRKSFLGGNSSSVRGTDYGSNQTDGFDLPYTASSTKYPGRNTSSNDTFSRSGVQARRTSASSGVPFTYNHEDNSRIRSQKAFANFPTKFERDDTDEDEAYDVRNGNGLANKDPFDFVEDSYSSQPSARRSPLSSRRRDPVQPPQGDLIDFGGDDDPPQRSTYGQPSRRRATGMDSLDEELQQRRESVDTDESRDRYSYEKTRNTTATAGWRADYGLPDDDYAAPPPPTRPPMHQRTSSAQKLWNRVRGNSQSAQRSAFADSWEARQTTNGSPKPFYSEPSSRKRSGSNAARRTTPSPGPDYLGRGTTPPAAAIVAAAIGRTGSATPTAGYMSESRSHRGTPPIPATVEVQVLAQFDFVGEEENDLSFKRGDVIDILRKTDNRDDWWLGRSADGRIGK
ncbi:hypothetical protein L7F22_042118 [Adiantum nelumboides]|nr:hypothetical protein [Adiantum nelumboides]